LDNCLAPYRIKYKLKHGYTFTKRYDYLINYFSNPNYLAESITSENPDVRKLALELMNCESEHIFKGIGWYLHNGTFIEKNHDKILFVGKQENMVEDVEKLNKILGDKLGDKNKLFNCSHKKIRENTYENTYLSTVAIENLLEFYKETDYKALEFLHKYNFINKKTLDEYFIYE